VGVDDRISTLKTVPIFAGLSDRNLKRVIDIAKEVMHTDGQAVMEEDASAAGLHVILEGEADIAVHGQHVATFGPGDYFGEMSIIDGKPRSATVTAKGTLRTLGIPAWTFETLMERHPSIMRTLLTELSSRIRGIEATRS
jgi:CRP-like cAMP-binding protein